MCNAVTEEREITNLFLEFIDMNQELANEVKKTEELTKVKEGLQKELNSTETLLSDMKKERSRLLKQVS